MAMVMGSSLDGLVWMQDAIKSTGKSRYWIEHRCKLYKHERRHYIKQADLDAALLEYVSVKEIHARSVKPITEAAHA